MPDRERLIELQIKAYKEWSNNTNTDISVAEFVADHILADGWIRPPCKVHDTVYYLNTKNHMALYKNKIYEAKVVRIVTTYLGTCLVIQIRDEFGCCEIPDIRDWGKNVFLTKEEAEQELKEREQGGC